MNTGGGMTNVKDHVMSSTRDKKYILVLQDRKIIYVVHIFKYS